MTARAKVYVVVPAAVYDHGIVGVFSTQDAARCHAESLWRDSDGHHRYRIEEWPVDVGSFSRGPDRYWSVGQAAPTEEPPEIDFVSWEEADGAS